MGARNPNIRVVPDAPEPKPAAKRRKSVDAAAAGGDHLELLVAMRDRIAKTVASPDCPPRDLAALTRRLQDIAKDIAALKRQAEQEGGGSGGGDGDEDWDPEAI